MSLLFNHSETVRANRNISTLVTPEQEVVSSNLAGRTIQINNLAISSIHRVSVNSVKTTLSRILRQQESLDRFE